MAMKVPNPYEQNVAIGPTGGLSGLQKAPETKYGLDKVVSGATGAFAKAVGQWQDEIDRTNAQDAINKTDRQLQDLETNKDSGWANILGENALNRPDGKSLVDEYLEKAKQIMDGHRSALKTPAARRYYEKYAQTAYQQEGNRLQTHLVTQQKNYAKATDQLTIDMAREQARSGDLNRMRSGFATMDVMMQKLANQTGLPVDRYKMIGSLHLEAIENFIDDKKPDAANAWLSANKDSMSPDQIRKAKELIKGGKSTQTADVLAPKLVMAYKEQPGELLRQIDDIKDEDTREKVRSRVNKQLAAIERQRKADLSEKQNLALQFVDQQAEIPDTLLGEIKALDRKTYERLTKVDRQGRPKVSDENSLSELSNLMNYKPDEFAQIDLNDYVDKLAPKDFSTFSLFQKNMGKASFASFNKALENRMNMDKYYSKNPQRKAEVRAAAMQVLEDYRQQVPKGYITPQIANMLIDQLLGKEDTLLFAKRGYQIVNKNRSEGVSALGTLAMNTFDGDSDVTSDVRSILKAKGVYGTATAQQTAAARQLAKGLGYPPEIWKRAESNVLKKAAARIEAGKPAKVTNQIIAREADQIIFGSGE